MADDLVQRMRTEAHFPETREVGDMLTKGADEIERLRAEVAKLLNERDFLVGKYERAVECGEQGYVHCAGHLFNAITNARIDARIAERELAALRERIEKAPVAETWETDWGGRAPNSLVADVPAAIGEGKRVRLVREDDT